MKDSWCAPIFADGQWLYGGAARNKRLGAVGGVDEVVRDVWMKANKAVEDRDAQNSNVVPLRRRRFG